MEFESEEDNVFWASHWEFCIFIVLADAGFSPCSNILCAVIAIGAIMVLEVSVDKSSQWHAWVLLISILL